MNRILLVLVTASSGFLLARASAVPVPFRTRDEARLRLSWSARPERLETCRAATAEELSRELEHMRQRIECEGRSATYALRVRVDEGEVEESIVRGGGFRHDRPLHLLRDLALNPGIHRVRLEFERREAATPRDSLLPGVPAADSADTGVFAGRAERERIERVRRTRAAIPPRLSLDTSLGFAPGEVVLVTFDAERRRLEVRTAPPEDGDRTLSQ